MKNVNMRVYIIKNCFQAMNMGCFYYVCSINQMFWKLLNSILGYYSAKSQNICSIKGDYLIHVLAHFNRVTWFLLNNFVFPDTAKNIVRRKDRIISHFSCLWEIALCSKLYYTYPFILACLPKLKWHFFINMSNWHLSLW